MSTTIRFRAKSISWSNLQRVLAGSGLANVTVHAAQFLGRAAREVLMRQRLSQKLSGVRRVPGVPPARSAFHQLKAVLETLTEPEFSVLEALARPKLNRTTLSRHLEQVLAHAQSGDATKLAAWEPALERDLQQLGQTLYASHLELACREKEALRGAVQQSLLELGYQVSQKETGQEWILRGQRGDESFFGVISPNADLSVDFAGFQNKTCERAFAELGEKLKAHGVEIEIQHQEFHGKREGGALARRLKAGQQPLFNPLQAPVRRRRLPTRQAVTR